MHAILHEIQYLGPTVTWAQYTDNSNIILEACENYQKKSYRNRCNIAGANGVIALSIPLRKGKNDKTPIRLVEIAQEEDWIRLHLQSIKSAYGSAPYFEYYFEPLSMILNKRHQYLFDLNLELFRWMLKSIRMDIHVELTDAYRKEYPEDILDYRSQSPKTVRVNDEQSKPYTQVFTENHGIISNTSILDLLFCTGPEASMYLKSIA